MQKNFLGLEFFGFQQFSVCALPLANHLVGSTLPETPGPESSEALNQEYAILFATCTLGDKPKCRWKRNSVTADSATLDEGYAENEGTFHIQR